MDADRCRAELPSLSIVIPSHNRPDLLRRCLASVDRFAPPGTQIIVVDDASANARVSRVAVEFGGIQVIRLPMQSGFCVAANRGIAAAHGDVIELLNDDTVVEEGWAAAGLEPFRDARVAAVAPLVLQLNGSPVPQIDSAGDCYHLGGFAGKRGRGKSVAAFAPSRTGCSAPALRARFIGEPHYWPSMPSRNPSAATLRMSIFRFDCDGWGLKSFWRRNLGSGTGSTVRMGSQIAAC